MPTADRTVVDREVAVAMDVAGDDSGVAIAPDAAADVAPADSASPVIGPRAELVPPELPFNAARGARSIARVLAVHNLGTSPLTVTSATFRGAAAAAFTVMTPPALPAQVAPGAELTFHIVFAPGAATSGVHQAALQIASDDPTAATLDAGLFGLATSTVPGQNEPTLADVVKTLGYRIDVGGTGLGLGTGADPIGDEVHAQRFLRAGPGPVTLTAVARFSPDEVIPYGYYAAGAAKPVLMPIAVIQAGQAQMLLPAVQAGAKPDFDPGDARFGIFTDSKSHTVYTEDAFNTGVKHAVRSFPLKDRGGQAIAHVFLVCFEEAANGDYNDYVFVLGNVTPAP